MFVPLRKNWLIEENYKFRLPILKGSKVLVNIGEQINIDTVLTTGEIFKIRSKIDVAKYFEIKPEKVKDRIRCLHGEMIKQGDKIAIVNNKILGIEKAVIAPKSGVIDLSEVDKGFVKIMGPGEEQSENAGIAGTVNTIVKDKFVEVSTTVLKIKTFRIEGAKKIGEIVFLEELDKEHGFGPELKGKIVVLKNAEFIEAIRDFALYGVKGIVVPSIPAALFTKNTEELLYGITLVVLDGFGKFGLSPFIKNIIEKNQSYLAQIDKNSNELILSFISKELFGIKNDNQVEELKEGKSVQTFDVLYWGSYGKIKSIDPQNNKVTLTLDDSGKQIESSILNIVSV